MFLCSSTALAVDVTAAFTPNTTSGDAPLSVAFTDNSINASTYEWNFGDGSPNSTVQSPTHTFTSAGTYDVVLTAINGSDSNSTGQTITVNAAPTGVSASFTANTTSGSAPLSVAFTDTSTNAASYEWNFGDGSPNSTVQSPTHTFTSAGTYDVVLTAINGSESSSTGQTITVNAASTGVSASFTANTTSGSAPLSVAFTDTSTNAVSYEWNFGDGSPNSTVQSPTHTFTSAGTYDVVLTAINGSESSSTGQTITVNAPSSTPPVASFTTNVTEGSVPLDVAFTDTSSDATSWEWNFDDGSSNSTEQNPNHTFSSAGTFNVTLTAINSDGSDSETKEIKVYQKTYYSGDRIWDASEGQSTTYTWNANSFSGFFYDLDSGISSESMTITGISRSIGDGDLVYKTAPVKTEFERSEWGEYKVVGFMAEKYFAAYTANTDIDNVDVVSMMSGGQLSKVLMDSDDKKSVYSGAHLTLEEDYRLNIVEVDKDGDKVFVTLTKDGDELDSGVVSGGSDYIYKTDLGDSDDVVLIAIHFDEIFSGSESNAVFVEGIFQISDEYIEVDDYSDGKMEVKSVNSTEILMENDDSISLKAGNTIEIMGKISFIVADSDDLRFAPFVDMTDPGTYELRSTVVVGDTPFTWTPLNFEGFYYDIDEGIQTETLEIESISGRTIDDDKLVYTSKPEPVRFERSTWGSFNVIGFMAEKYFAGYPSDTFGDSDSYNLLSSGQLSKVLIDDDGKRSLYTGQSLTLEEGYELEIEQVDKNGDRVLISLTKDGDEVDEDVVSSRDSYIYKKDLGDSDDVPIIAVYFDEIFSGRESNAVFVEGIFQVSDDYLELEVGDNYGDMEITKLGESIIMKNEDSISLSRDKDFEIMTNPDDDDASISVKVADSDTLRYYFYVEEKTGPTGTLSVDLDKSVVTEDEEVIITVTSRGAAISDATVKVEDVSIGKTDAEGIITYTADQVGDLEIIAEKTGYTSGSEDLEVISPDDETKKLIIEVSPDDVYEGTSATIFVLKAIGGDTIQGAEVTLDGKSIGSTSLDGTITHTMTDAGMHKIKATKSGYIDAELDIEVQELAAKFEFTNLRTAPLDVKEGNEATISVDVTNVGTAAGEYTVDLRVNNTVVDSQIINLGIDESTTVEFKHTEEEAGTYVIKVQDLEKTYEVFEGSGIVWYALGAIVLIGAGGLGYLFTAGGWTVEIAQAKIEEAIRALQELVGNLR
ncbi:S-layer protein domain-containing protein [Methanolobus sp. ZRKC2]|uniref:S-layer protein domain-containing protein n=1 Tax=Methanolobus sp. ZRKC2 TaxID=3125783 RepID=UPI00324FDE37